ncbi:hypothetical protein L228DRAFT_42791 [Xylona heveae TC161]|uniref:C2H2-type domain-containing protein n=1 Tax=Xylona heveae (strain CBS 132557 / TC161) TaxID=1328760 RepID=A0A164ZR11_XYLHT|nr:hypothetical protein L228DRAFT_42791 [Xylona heveae TC161]KZF19399.1 hypothetical protein L228DRAFT_42791 [Xylona heveae TC161]
MERTPQSLRSSDSVSPYHQSRRRVAAFPFDSSHPTSPQNTAKHAPQGQERGLGLYGYSMAPTTSPLPANILPPSPQPTEYWSRQPIPEQNLVYHTQGPPDVFSEAYDPFASLSGAPAESFMRSAYNPPPQPATEYRNADNLQSQRSSVSSGPASDIYSQVGSDLGYSTSTIHPKVKVEDPNDWFPVTSTSLPAAFPNHNLITAPQASFPTPIEGHSAARTIPPSLSEYEALDEDDRPYFGRNYKEHSTGFQDLEAERYEYDRPLITCVARTRKRRQLTTPAEANHECRICGKLFGRSYNYKAHMETHDPARVYPHPCTVKNCTKKFVRKTDLLRHQDSVHFKSRNFGCNLCGSQFARKDTLRRYFSLRNAHPFVS